MLHSIKQIFNKSLFCFRLCTYQDIKMDTEHVCSFAFFSFGHCVLCTLIYEFSFTPLVSSNSSWLEYVYVIYCWYYGRVASFSDVFGVNWRNKFKTNMFNIHLKYSNIIMVHGHIVCFLKKIVMYYIFIWYYSYTTYFFQILKKKNTLTWKCKFMIRVNNSNLVNGPVLKYKFRCLFRILVFPDINFLIVDRYLILTTQLISGWKLIKDNSVCGHPDYDLINIGL